MDRYKISKKDRILLVIAHPDDEAMFFTPLLSYFARMRLSGNVHIVCMTDGNSNGLGHVRRKELYESASIFSISKEQVHIVRHPDIEDGFDRIWPVETCYPIIKGYIQVIKPTIVVTFDEYGVSGHPNHIATYRAVYETLHSICHTGVVGLALDSVHVCRKFNVVGDYFLTWFYNDHIIINFGLVTVIRAMLAHYSQFVWYRWLFVLFSRYTYINSFRRVY